MSGWQVQSGDYKFRMESVGRRFNYEFIDWRSALLCKAVAGWSCTPFLEEIWSSLSRYAVSERTLCSNQAFFGRFKKKPRPSYDLSLERDSTGSLKDCEEPRGIAKGMAKGMVKRMSGTWRGVRTPEDTYISLRVKQRNARNAPGEPWFTWEMNVLSRMEHATNSQLV